MSRSMLRIALISTILLLAGTLAYAETFQDTIERTLPFPAGNRLSVSNTNGDIEVSTWDRDEVKIVADKKVKSSNEGRAKEAFEALKVVIDESSGGITVSTEYPKSMGGWFGNVNSQVRYSIQIPHQADLELDTVNGKVTVEGVQGQIGLESTNGGIRVEDAGGSVTARTTNGSIDCELREVGSDEDMNFRTTNGSITLTLPSDTRANLSARTTNGSVSTDFPITVQGTFRKNRLEGDLNGGGANLELKTTNGSIKIREF